MFMILILNSNIINQALLISEHLKKKKNTFSFCLDLGSFLKKMLRTFGRQRETLFQDFWSVFEC